MLPAQRNNCIALAIKQAAGTPEHDTGSTCTGSSALGIQEHVLADGQPKDVLRGLQRKAEPPHIVAEDLQSGSG